VPGGGQATVVDPEEGPGLYVHVPFCTRRCVYCAFCSQTDLSLREAYLDALGAEAARVQGEWGSFDTVYVGGGTPTVLGVHGLERLVAALAPLDAAEAEWTVEANPDDVDADSLTQLRALGFQRLSLGVQALDDEALRSLGRRHDAASAVQAMADARRAGWDEVSADLIYARPGQDIGSWLAELDRALDLEPTHLSAYELTVEPGTPLAARVERAEVRLPTEQQRRALFLATARHLRERGWDHYEVSSFARSPRHRSRHNLKYWSHVPFLGLGPGAHNFDGRHRWWNTSSVVEYVDLLSRGRSPVEEREELDRDALRLERLALGLRTAAGVDPADVVGHEAAIDEAVAGGLLVVEEARLRPTLEGLVVADWLAVRLA